jgi:hypothetical protein
VGSLVEGAFFFFFLKAAKKLHFLSASDNEETVRIALERFFRTSRQRPVR